MHFRDHAGGIPRVSVRGLWRICAAPVRKQWEDFTKFGIAGRALRSDGGSTMRRMDYGCIGPRSANSTAVFSRSTVGSELMKLAGVMLFAMGVSAQSLQILSSPPGHESATFRIMLASPEKKAPVALQWRLSLPEGVELKEIVPGAAAEAAQKSVTCSGPPAGSKTGAGPEYRCVLVGGQAALPDGPVVVVKCALRSGLREAVVRVRDAVGVSVDSKQIPIAETQGTITAQ